MLILRNKRWYFALVIFILSAITYMYFAMDANDAVTKARLALTHVIVDEGVIYIDSYQDNVFDIALYNGHYYTPHSPGPSLIAVPVYTLWKTVSTLPFVPQAVQESERLERYFTIILTVSLISALLNSLLFLFLTKFTPKLKLAFLLTLAYGLGTIAFPYSTRFFQHQLSAFCMFVGFYIMWQVVYEKASLRWLWLSGALFGIGVICEYPAIIIVAFIMMWFLFATSNKRSIYRVVLGGLPFGLILAVYNYAIFSDPFTFAYSYHIYWGEAVHSQGFGGILLPSVDVILELLFGTFRGLFFISPFLLLAFPGFYLMWRSSKANRNLAILVAVIVGSGVLYNSAYLVWWGGWTIGPRFLTTTIPFLVIPIIFVLDVWFKSWSRWIILLLIGLSIANVGIQSLAGLSPDVLGEPPNENVDYGTWVIAEISAGDYVYNPLLDYSIPTIIRGDFRHTLGTLLLGSKNIVAAILPLLVIWVLMGLFFHRLSHLSDSSHVQHT